MRWDLEKPESLLERCRTKLKRIVVDSGLADANLEVLVKPLSPQEAIGNPGRRDFPIVEGRERVVEARILGSRAHAFTDSPREFVGKLGEVLDLPLSSNQNRALFVSAMNGVLQHLGIVEKVIHCRDEDPERCAREIASRILGGGGRIVVGLIGLNPAIAEALCSEFGEGNVRITDLNRQNIGTRKFGVQIWDGRLHTERLIMESDFILATGTTLVNGTLDDVMDKMERHGKDYLLYGVTAAGACALSGLPRICPFGR